MPEGRRDCLAQPSSKLLPMKRQPSVLGSLAEHLAPRYRKRQVPLDDVIALCEGLRTGARTVITPGAGASVDAAVDAAIAALKWHRRLAGDARKRNAFIAFIYKGA